MAKSPQRQPADPVPPPAHHHSAAQARVPEPAQTRPEICPGAAWEMESGLALASARSKVPIAARVTEEPLL